MQNFLIRLVGYSFLFIVSLLLVNFDHATPGTDEPAVASTFWASFKIAYALGFTFALGGFFEKISAEKLNLTFSFKTWFILLSLFFFFSGIKLQYDSGQLLQENGYTYFLFFLYGIFTLSVYLDIFSDKGKTK